MTAQTSTVDASEDRIRHLLSTIEKLQTSDSSYQLQARRAERELREEREKFLKIERELEGWKGLRVERSRGSLDSSGSMRALSEIEVGSEELNSGRRISGVNGPKRMFSNSKGFL